MAKGNRVTPMMIARILQHRDIERVLGDSGCPLDPLRPDSLRKGIKRLAAGFPKNKRRKRQ